MLLIHFRIKCFHIIQIIKLHYKLQFYYQLMNKLQLIFHLLKNKPLIIIKTLFMLFSKSPTILTNEFKSFIFQMKIKG